MLASTWEHLTAALCQKTKDNRRHALVLTTPGMFRRKMPTLIYRSTWRREERWIKGGIEGERTGIQNKVGTMSSYLQSIRGGQKKNPNACGQSQSREIWVDERDSLSSTLVAKRQREQGSERKRGLECRQTEAKGYDCMAEGMRSCIYPANGTVFRLSQDMILKISLLFMHSTYNLLRGTSTLDIACSIQNATNIACSVQFKV